MNTAQRISEASEVLEYAVVDLLTVAERLSLTGPTISELRVRRCELLSCARQYGSAVRRLARMRS